MGIKNWFVRTDQVLTIDVPDTDATALVTLMNFPGMHTIKNINPKNSDDLFYFRENQNIIPGYVESGGGLTLDLIDNRKKIVKSFCRSYYHCLLDNLSELIAAIEQHPDHDVILDISNISDLIDNQTAQGWDFINHFLRILTKKNIKYKLVRLIDYDIIYMDNFVIADYPADSNKKTNNIYDFFKPSINTQGQEPFRHVFISRKYAHGQAVYSHPEDVDVRADGLGFSSDERMDDHSLLEEIFVDLGYEVVYSEMFKTFQDQIDYFHTAKTIASLTGSGLTNGAFMQPGGTLIEITTPLVVSIPAPGESSKDLSNLYYVQEIHNFYKNIAYYQDLYFFTIQNPNRSIEEFKNRIESDKHVRAFLDRNE